MGGPPVPAGFFAFVFRAIRIASILMLRKNLTPKNDNVHAFLRALASMKPNQKVEPGGIEPPSRDSRHTASTRVSIDLISVGWRAMAHSAPSKPSV